MWVTRVEDDLFQNEDAAAGQNTNEELDIVEANKENYFKEVVDLSAQNSTAEVDPLQNYMMYIVAGQILVLDKDMTCSPLLVQKSFLDDEAKNSEVENVLALSDGCFVAMSAINITDLTNLDSGSLVSFYRKRMRLMTLLN